MTLSTPVLFGAAYSVYVRIVMMALQTKGVAYHHVPVDVFAASGLPDWYETIHPFRKIPAFRHEEVTLYEANVITRYIDDAFPGPPLQPETPSERAIMAQIIAITDAYGYRPLVWDIYVEKISKPRLRPCRFGRILWMRHLTLLAPHMEIFCAHSGVHHACF